MPRTFYLFAIAGLILFVGLVTCSERGESDSAAVFRERIERAVEATQDAIVSDEEEWLAGQLYRIGEEFDGRVGLAVVDVGRERSVHHNGNELMPQQSVSKLWVALTALDQADRGDFSIEDVTTIRRQDLTLFYQPVRSIVLTRGSFTTSYRDLIRRAIIQSDNTANDMVLNAIGGPDAVRETIVQKRLGAIRFGPGERIMQSGIAGLEWRQSYSIANRFYEARDRVPDEVRSTAFEGYISDPVDGATPNAIAQALARLARGELLSAGSTRAFMQWLTEVKSGPNRLKGGIAPGWTIGHKTGTGQVYDPLPRGGPAEQAGYNDVGILTAPNGDQYAVAVLVARTAIPLRERMAMMHEVVGAVIAYHNAANGEPLPIDGVQASDGE